ncbi:MAG: TIGR01212 family radical SAM protein, partial [bacterium]
MTAESGRETGERYRSFSGFLRERFGERVYKVSIDAGFTCPNRDGTLGVGGCIYCNNTGFSPNTRRDRRPVREQALDGMEYMRRRYRARRFIAYFQAYTNTYAPVERLEALYGEALSLPDVVGLSIGTRPDCVDEKVLNLVESYAGKYHVWLELGLQSARNRTLRFLNRGHTVETFEAAAARAKRRRGIHVCAHVILGLPGETRRDMLASAGVLTRAGVDGAKIHLMHVLGDTPLERMYREGKLATFTMHEYARLVCDYL